MQGNGCYVAELKSMTGRIEPTRAAATR